MIDVKRLPGTEPMLFGVTVREGASQSRHEVSMAQTTWEKLNSKNCSPEKCVEAAFVFLLEREPKEAILASFDIMLIKRYFPEFEREFPNYLDRNV